MAITKLLDGIGASYHEYDDGLSIQGNPKLTFDFAHFESFHDHRIAMASAVAALRGNKASTIKDAEAAAVSYPEFWDHLELLRG